MHLNDLFIIMFSYVFLRFFTRIFFICSDYIRDKNNFARMPKTLRPPGDCTRKHTNKILAS